MLGLGGGGGGANPGGSIYPPINKVLAPNFTVRSFIFWVSVAQVCVFVAELFVGQFVENGAFVASNSMAGPNTETLKIMGGKYLPCIQNGEVYRFITPAFLHAGILHIFTNLVSQTMIGYTCELHWGFWRMFSFYFATSFGATLLSCVGSPGSVSVGASGALLGVIGAYMAWILLNWNNRVLLPQPCQRMCTMIVWLFIIMMIGISMAGIDNWAHFGGWLSGMFIGFAFNTASQPISWLDGKVRPLKISFTVVTVAYFLSTLLSSFFAISTAGYGACWA
jgi:membrane associated rhomboid family serine protease